MKTENQITHSLHKVKPSPLAPFQLALMYGLSSNDFKELIHPFQEEIGKPKGWRYTPEQVEIIFGILGAPCIMKKVVQEKPKTIVLPGIIELLVIATWNFSRAILWNGQKFTTAEIELSKQLIRQYYASISPDEFSFKAKEFFIQYLERVMLAKAYCERSDYRFIPHPCIWLNKEFTKGFAGTKSWYSRIKEQRQLDPTYHQHIRSVSEIYAEHILNPSQEVFQKAAKAFSYRDSNLLLLFCQPGEPQQCA